MQKKNKITGTIMMVYKLLIVLLLASIDLKAQEDTLCFNMLQKMFEKINFVAHPIEPNKMFYYVTETETKYHDVNPKEYPDENLEYDYRLSNNSSILLTEESNVYYSPSIKIRIYKPDKLIFIYDSPNDNMRKKEADEMVEYYEQFISSMKNASCKPLNDTMLYFELNGSDSSVFIKKTLLLNTRTFYMQEYTVHLVDENGINKTVKTSTKKVEIQKKDKDMKQDFLRFIYNSKNELLPMYATYKIIDKRRNH